MKKLDLSVGNAFSSMVKNVFAHTAPGCDLPEFVSVNQHVDGSFSIMTRSPKEHGGDLAQASLDRAKARELGFALIQATN